jgi:lambda family phage tail tape measure protein
MSQTTELLLRVRQIGGEQLQQLGRSLNKLGKEATDANQDFATLATQLKSVQATSANSINNLRGYANSWRQIANSVEIGTAEFKQATAEAAKLEAQLAKTEGRRAGGGRLAGIAQTVGTIAGAGVFGGPEGALGAAIGSIGGVPGAITGGAIGAQVGQLRQLLGSTADYVAEVNKLKIALEGVAGSQQEYTKALQIADQATRQFNVPQEVAIQGMTRLTAAVKGAGGQVADAGLVFTNITKAIKGTGGSAEDVQGAITAMVQVFSKGKVSAEELSGQLGERLPGAVTLFAKANKMTLPELQKGLKDGQIGLNELMRFIELLGTRYGMTALKIAASSEDSGARLRIAFNDMRLAVGGALQPIGAELQNSFGQFISVITPGIVTSAKILGQALLGLTKILDDVVFAITVFGSTVATIKIVGFVLALQNATTASVVLSGAIGLVETAIKRLGLSLLAIPGWGWIAAGVTALALLGKALYDNNQDFQNWANNISRVVSNDIRAAMKQLSGEVETGVKNAAGFFKSLSDYVGVVATDIAKKFSGVGKSVGATGKDASDMWGGALKSIQNNTVGLLKAVQIAITGLYNALPAPLRKFIDQPSAIKDIGKVIQYIQGASSRAAASKPSGARTRPANDLTGGLTNFAAPGGDGGGGGGDAKTKKAKELVDISLEELNIRKQLAALDAGMNPVQEAYLNYRLQILKIDKQVKDRQIGIRDAEIQRIEANDKLNEVIEDGRKRGVDALLEIDRLTKQQAISLEDVKAQYGLISRQQAEQLRFEREIAKLREGAKGTRLAEETEKVIKKLEELQAIARTAGGQIAASFYETVKSMGELTKNLGASLGNTFMGLADVVAEFVTTGKASFADFTRSVLADLTKIFVRAAFFYTLKSLLPGGSFLGKLFGFEKGGIMTGDGPMSLKRYANGGIANSPQLAMFGEGSRPEAYVPLPDGRTIPVTMNNGAGGTNVIVNVDAKGTSVQGNAPNAKALGTVVSSAVQAEILKQQRPGGLLASTR